MSAVAHTFCSHSAVLSLFFIVVFLVSSVCLQFILKYFDKFFFLTFFW